MGYRFCKETQTPDFPLESKRQADQEFYWMKTKMSSFFLSSTMLSSYNFVQYFLSSTILSSYDFVQSENVQFIEFSVQKCPVLFCPVRECPVWKCLVQKCEVRKCLSSTEWHGNSWCESRIAKFLFQNPCVSNVRCEVRGAKPKTSFFLAQSRCEVLSANQKIDSWPQNLWCEVRSAKWEIIFYFWPEFKWC